MAALEMAVSVGWSSRHLEAMPMCPSVTKWLQKSRWWQIFPGAAKFGGAVVYFSKNAERLQKVAWWVICCTV